MIKKIIILVLSLIIISGCTSNTNTEEKSLTKYNEFTIKTKLLNKESDDGVYNVYLMPVGLRNENPGEANQSGFYGPFKTDVNGEVKIDLSYNQDLAWYIESEENDKPGYLEIYITTEEDKYIRNPLNKKYEIKFIKNDSEEPYPEYPYYSSKSEFEVEFTDKYPNNVLSLTFQDATFVIKFEFEDGFEPKSSYVAGLNWTGTIYNSGRINREFQYWDLPFFKSDNLQNRVGTIYVKDFDTNKAISYEGEPKTLTFDENGKCHQGNIITIKILKHD